MRSKFATLSYSSNNAEILKFLCNHNIFELKHILFFLIFVFLYIFSLYILLCFLGSPKQCSIEPLNYRVVKLDSNLGHSSNNPYICLYLSKSETQNTANGQRSCHKVLFPCKYLYSFKTHLIS